MSAPTETTTAATSGPAAPASTAPDTPASAAPIERTPEELEELAKKVFVRQLHPSVKEADVKDIFVPVLDVDHVQIIRRGARHQGYGFVTFTTADDAVTAIDKYNGKDLGGRTLVIEPLKHTVTESSQNRKARKPRVKQSKVDGSSSPAPPVTSGAEDAADPVTEKEKSKPNGRKSSQKKKNKGSAVADKDSRTRKGELTGPPSETLVFVANLAYSVEQAELKQLFEQDTELHVKGIYIARALVRRPRKLTNEEKEAAEAAAQANAEAAPVPTKKMVGERRSRGYAFVDFETHQQQQEAIKLFNDKEFHGRNLVLKVALENEERKKKLEDASKSKAKRAKASTPKESVKEEGAQDGGKEEVATEE